MSAAWLAALGGGVLIGTAAVLLMAFEGHILGVSGILGNALRHPTRNWRWAVLAGLVATGVLARMAGAAVPTQFAHTGWLRLAVSGVLIGLGTALANGCTSGHGVCGLGNRSGRSLVAVAIFMAVAVATVFISRLEGWAS
ncbi:YeeE/YedE family protein [Acetobacter fabarum]|uniref:YeeE/YedE family protein n=1 Tax=Acetobacter fabarum TaxID=483199 RepID=UPI00209C96FD|nr:YeeE/YedE family protein [Acetobacter fabarum]MCP1229146.1 YeeE/YedE family protein [Acetobacter fabarum]MCP1234630.1 YeeE/YedE family protein [Acetobacter fabarum]